MAILSALQSAALLLIGRKPTTFYGSAETFEMEIADLANEVATDIAKYQDWQALTTVYEIAGDGSTVMYDLPADYDRMLINSDVQAPSNWVWGYRPFTDLNTFLFEQARGFSPYPGGWIIYSNKLRFSPAPSTTAMFPYITLNYAKDSDGNGKPAFTSDNDTFVLPERLLKLGLIWRWRENKKLDASGDQEAFVKAIEEYGSKDTGSKILRFGTRSPMRGMARIAYTGIAY